jgi:diguanylate cyclase (GGDEF)-like protein
LEHGTDAAKKPAFTGYAQPCLTKCQDEKPATGRLNRKIVERLFICTGQHAQAREPPGGSEVSGILMNDRVCGDMTKISTRSQLPHSQLPQSQLNRSHSTRSQMIVIAILIVAAIIGGTGLIISMQRQAAIDAFQTATTNLANGMARQTAHYLTPADQALRNVKMRLAATPPTSPAVYALLSSQVAQASGVDALVLLGADGRVVNHSQGWPAQPLDLSGRDYFSHFKADDDPAAFAGMPEHDPASGVWTLPLALRINDAQGRFAGVIVAEISLADLSAFYQLAMPPHRTVFLARRDGVALLRYPAQDADIGRRIPATSLWYARVAAGGGTYVAPALFSPAPVIAVVRPLYNLPVILEASCTQSDALLQWQQERIWVVLGGFFSALCALGVLRLFERQFDRIEASERRLAAKNAELDLTQQQLQVTLANLSQGVCFFDENNQLRVFNRRFCEIIGLPIEHVHIGMPAGEIAELRIAAGTFWDATAEEYLASLAARIRAGVPVDEVSELLDGRTIAKHFEPLTDHGWVMTLEDISERRSAERKIAYLAHHDLLTGLANRALFRDQLGHAFTDPAPAKSFAMLCLDLDRFKAVNDSFGHPVGDGLLVAVADRLRAAVRAGDTVARLGGDEFVILQLNVSDLSETIALAHRIVETISTPFVIEGHLLSIGVSIGIAMAPGDRMNAEQLLKHADQALYRSKQAGRGTWRIFDAAMETAAP